MASTVNEGRRGLRDRCKNRRLAEPRDHRSNYQHGHGRTTVAQKRSKLVKYDPLSSGFGRACLTARPEATEPDPRAHTVARAPGWTAQRQSTRGTHCFACSRLHLLRLSTSRTGAYQRLFEADRARVPTSDIPARHRVTPRSASQRYVNGLDELGAVDHVNPLRELTKPRNRSGDSRSGDGE